MARAGNASKRRQPKQAPRQSAVIVPTPEEQSHAVEETWAEMEKLVRRLNSLSMKERQVLHSRFHGLPTQEKEQWWAAMLAYIPMDQLVDSLNGLFAFAGIGFFGDGAEGERAFVQAIEDRFIPKPRNTVRDREIVRLRDEEKLSFGRIGKKLNLSRDAVEKAYHRKKKRCLPADKKASP